MAVNSDSVIKCFDILENKAVSLSVVHDAESVKPFTLNKCMKGFDAGVIVRIAGIAILVLKTILGLLNQMKI